MVEDRVVVEAEGVVHAGVVRAVDPGVNEGREALLEEGDFPDAGISGGPDFAVAEEREGDVDLHSGGIVVVVGSPGGFAVAAGVDAGDGTIAGAGEEVKAVDSVGGRLYHHILKVVIDLSGVVGPGIAPVVGAEDFADVGAPGAVLEEGIDPVGMVG